MDRRAPRARRPRRIVVADDGLTLHHHGYTENIAHALLLALEQPDAAAGKLFNIADEEVLSVRQVVEIIAAALDHEFEIVSMPYDLAVPGPAAPRAAAAHPPGARRHAGPHRPRVPRPWCPAREAVARTARWLVDHPLVGSTEEYTLTDPFDYEAEDRLIDAWLAARATVPAVRVRVGAALGPRVQRARRPPPVRARCSRPERSQAGH